MSGRRTYYSSGDNLTEGGYDDPQGSSRESRSFEQEYDRKQGSYGGNAHQISPKGGRSIRGMGNEISRSRGSREYEEQDDEPQYSKGGSNRDQEESDEEELGDEPQYSNRGSPTLPGFRKSPLSGLRGGGMPLGNQSQIGYGSRQYENNNSPRGFNRGGAGMVGSNSTGFGSSGMLGTGGGGRAGLMNQMGSNSPGMGGRGMQAMRRDPRGFRGAINPGSNRQNRPMPNFMVGQGRQGRRNGRGRRQQLINIRQNITTPMTAFGIPLNGAGRPGFGVNTRGFNPRQQQQQLGMWPAVSNKKSVNLGGNSGRQGFEAEGRCRRRHCQPQPFIPGEPFDEKKHGHLTPPVVKEHRENLQKAKARGDLGGIATANRDFEVALEKLSGDRLAEMRNEWQTERANGPQRTPRGPRQ